MIFSKIESRLYPEKDVLRDIKIDLTKDRAALEILPHRALLNLVIENETYYKDIELVTLTVALSSLQEPGIV
jgi:hypothetical protein